MLAAMLRRKIPRPLRPCHTPLVRFCRHADGKCERQGDRPVSASGDV